MFLPVVILVFGAILVFGIRLIKPGFGYTWLAAILACLSAWGLLLYFRFSPPQPVIISQWLPLGGISGSLMFQLDEASWAYAFSLSSLLCGVLLTAAARLQHQSNPNAWSASLAIGGVGILAVLAGTPLAVILSWTVIDTFELLVVILGIPDNKVKTEGIIAFFSRMAGTLSIVFAMILAQAGGNSLVLVDPGTGVGIFILIAVGLRLGIFPLHLPYTQDVPMRRGLGTMLRLTSPLTSLVILAKLPISIVPEPFSPILLGLASLAALYGAVKWLTAWNEIKGRPYWLISVTGMAIASSIRGYPGASIAWGVNLAISGGILFLFSVRSKWLRAYPLIGALMCCGLPFTHSAGGWFGLVVLPLNIPDFLFFAAQVALVLGYVNHAYRTEESPERLERWIMTVYPVGFGVMVLSSVILTIFGWNNSFTPGVWWASLPAALVSAVLFWRWRKLQNSSGQSHEDRWFILAGRRVGPVFSLVFSLVWFYRLLRFLLNGVQALVMSFSTILEGEGGVLWVLVLLALILSVSLAGIQ